MAGNPILWTPGRSRVEQSAMYRFMSARGFDNYADLHRWSIENVPAFWEAVAEFGGLTFGKPATETLVQAHVDQWGENVDQLRVVFGDVESGEQLLELGKRKMRTAHRNHIQLV